MRKITLLAVLLLASCAMSHPVRPVTIMSVFWDATTLEGEYDSLNEAAAAALAGAYAKSATYEVGGVLTQEGDKFRVGYPSTDFSGAWVSFDNVESHYRGKIVGTYHTHMCLKKHFIPESFSGADMDGDEKDNVEGFMLDTCTGDIHAYKPGVDVRYPRNQLTVGRIVGHVPVTGAELE